MTPIQSELLTHPSFPQSNSSTPLHRRSPIRQILALHRFSLRRPSLPLPRLPRKRHGRPFPLFDTRKPSSRNQNYYYNVLNPDQADKALSVAHIAEGATIWAGPKIRGAYKVIGSAPNTFRLEGSAPQDLLWPSRFSMDVIRPRQ